MPERIINFDDPKERARVMNGVRNMRGKWRFNMVRYRPRRTDRQNRYYWPCFVQPFANFLRDQGEFCTDDEAHEILKYRFLRRSKVNKQTGEVVEFIPSTTALDTAEFNEYLDRLAHWLADTFDIVVPDPSDYHERATVVA